MKVFERILALNISPTMDIQNDLFPEERRLAILKLLNQEGRASVNDLSQEFGVSEVTIRTDLQALASRSLILRTHGGAVPVNRNFALSLDVRRIEQTVEKDRIGSAAASMIENGEAIFLDTSSTSLAVARYLDKHRDLTVLTNSLALAHLLLDLPNVTVVMPGGILQRDTVSLVDINELGMLRRFNIQKGFFGAHGLTAAEGLTDVSAAEAEVKREMIKMCRQVIAILDATKWGRVGLASFAWMQDIHEIITDRNAPADQVEKARRHGLKVHLA
jgi:DeoR/GlpR family transcriptional regulator of sugar metabolism